jgi:hypothetical protein
VLTSDKRAEFAVLVIVQFTKSPTASVTDADAPAAPEGNELSVAPFLVQDRWVVIGQQAGRGRFGQGEVSESGNPVALPAPPSD